MENVRRIGSGGDGVDVVGFPVVVFAAGSEPRCSASATSVRESLAFDVADALPDSVPFSLSARSRELLVLMPV